jgi:micrococcal nuclease
MKRILLIFLVLSMIFYFGFYAGKVETQRNFSQSAADKNSKKVATSSIPREKQGKVETADSLVKVTRVLDGDTVELETGQKVRYIGINTPETVDSRKTVQCFGKEASSKNKELVEGKKVRLEKDVSETDKYGRLLRYVYVGDIFVNDYLVREGYAYATSYPPDVKYQDQFKKASEEAQKENKGLWGSCGTGAVLDTNSNSNSTGGTAGCVIKGNISSSGEKIYHLPGQRYYDKTAIDTSKGERWFCTETEAINAGWRKSKV